MSPQQFRKAAWFRFAAARGQKWGARARAASSATDLAGGWRWPHPRSSAMSTAAICVAMPESDWRTRMLRRPSQTDPHRRMPCQAQNLRRCGSNPEVLDSGSQPQIVRYPDQHRTDTSAPVRAGIKASHCGVCPIERCQQPAARIFKTTQRQRKAACGQQEPRMRRVTFELGFADCRGLGFTTTLTQQIGDIQREINPGCCR